MRSGAAASRWLDPPINALRQFFVGCLGSLAHIIKIKIPFTECHIISEIRKAAGVQMRPLRWFRETATAKRLRISKAFVSKQLQLLEVDLGVNLVIRSSRHLNLTEAGQSCFEAERASVTQHFTMLFSASLKKSLA
ncbi:LysR family transcriptional regulator [Ruegeria sp. ANG10]|uniref:helix-turn-helix domain-containing protein n=1 Tax=Ruegeria sp. ANG10 TaxID=3042467 RepID=UPI003455DC14